MTEIIEIIRNEEGEVIKINGIKFLRKLVGDYKKKYLPYRNAPFHHEAEISDGLDQFLRTIKTK